MQPNWAADSDGDSVMTYRLNIHRGDVEAQVLCRDVRKVAADELPDVHALLFGFPCNDFSEVGRRRGLRGEYGPLYLEAIRILRSKRPRIFVAENVKGLRQSHGGDALRQILDDLHYSGYAITPHLYRFDDYGVPQRRARIIIVGIRHDLAQKGVHFRPPAPSGHLVSARDALSSPVPPGTENAEPYTVAATVTRRLAAIRPGENIWEAQARPDFPDACRLNVRGKRLSLIYKRIDPDSPAPTVLGSGGGGTVGYHWDEPRPLTNRERARLQSFPDDFVFLGPPSSVRRQIGMAVPPLGAEAICTALLKSLAGVEYASVEPNIDWQPERRSRGRPRRIEAAESAARSRKGRARRDTENAVVARVLATAIEQGLAEEDELVRRFIDRASGRSVRVVDGDKEGTRSERNRRRAREERTAAAVALAWLEVAGMLLLVAGDDADAEVAMAFMERTSGRRGRVPLGQHRAGRRGAVREDLKHTR